jgi:DnaJ-class molecular chaperone
MNKFLSGYETYDPKAEGYGNRTQWRKEFFKRMSPDEASQILNAQDPYEVLGVTRKSTQAEIKKAFYVLINKWHPDKNPENIQEATQMSQLIIAAYSYLTR